MKHTPGNWKFRVVQQDGKTIALHLETDDPQVTHADPVILSIREDWISWLLSTPRGQADKNVIEAAPGLLAFAEAAHEFLSAGTPIHPGSELMAELEELLKKAKRQ